MPNTVTSEREAPIGACQCGGHDGGGPLLLSAERAAGLLGMHRSSLRRRITELGLELPSRDA